MNEFLAKMLIMFNKETIDAEKANIASMANSIAQKKYPLEYQSLKDKLNISYNTSFSDKTYYFMNNIDSYKYVDNHLLISKDDKELKLPVLDVVAFFNTANPNMTEEERFFVKVFFFEPSNFDKFQIGQFLFSLG